jgi:hypothetical protein
MQFLDFMARRHGVQVPVRVGLRGAFAACEYIAQRSTIMEECETYWLFVSYLTSLRQPSRCSVMSAMTTLCATSNVLPLGIALDFDETTVLTEKYEGSFEDLERFFNVVVPETPLSTGGMVDNLANMQIVADATGIPVEVVIAVHAIPWAAKMDFRPGVTGYVRAELNCGRYICVVSSSYLEVIATRLTVLGQRIRWSHDLQRLFWIFPEGEVQVYGRHSTKYSAKPSPMIYQKAIEESPFPNPLWGAFEDSNSGENGADNADVGLIIGVGERELRLASERIDNFVGFTPQSFDDIWQRRVGG